MPTDDEVEAGAKAILNHMSKPQDPWWSDLPRFLKTFYLELARSVLEAAEKVRQ